MKYKSVSTIAAILCLGLTTGLLCSSCKTGTVLLMNADDNLRISSSGFDIRGTVTDEDGNPLDGVTMEMAFSRVNTASFRSENLNETETVDSAFHVQRKGWTELQLTFWKDGYFPERLAFDSPWLEKGKKRYVEEDGVQVRMVKMGPIAKLYRTRTSDSIRLKYDFKQESGAICDLSMLQASEELDRRQYENIEATAFKLESGPEATKYLELDFRRDENGEIVFVSLPGALAPCPAELIVRLHSDDPGDGMILLNELDPDITEDKVYKKYNTAPETGYDRKEIAFALTDQWHELDKSTYFVYLKCGNHYGKARIRNLNIEIHRTFESAKAFIALHINRVPGDRNLTSQFGF